MALYYLNRFFSHFDGSYEKFFYCDQLTSTGARMRNINDASDTRTIALETAERTYIELSGDLLRKLVGDDAAATARAQYPFNGQKEDTMATVDINITEVRVGHVLELKAPYVNEAWDVNLPEGTQIVVVELYRETPEELAQYTAEELANTVAEEEETFHGHIAGDRSQIADWGFELVRWPTPRLVAVHCNVCNGSGCDYCDNQGHVIMPESEVTED